MVAWPQHWWREGVHPGIHITWIVRNYMFDGKEARATQGLIGEKH